MNKKALVIFLRQLQWVFIVFKLISGFLYVFMQFSCSKTFYDKNLLPPNIREASHPFYITLSFATEYITCVGLYIILWSILGIFGLIFLESRQLLNFAFGFGILSGAVYEFTGTTVLKVIRSSFNESVITPVMNNFRSTNSFIRILKKFKSLNFKHLNASLYLDGWNSYTNGTIFDKTNVDYVQTKLKCCGIEGRQFWDITIPRSCCSLENFGAKCILSVAYDKSCLSDYEIFQNCLFDLLLQMCAFAILSLVTGAISMYLSYMQILFPDDNYKSDTTSDTQEDGV